MTEESNLVVLTIRIYKALHKDFWWVRMAAPFYYPYIRIPNEMILTQEFRMRPVNKATNLWYKNNKWDYSYTRIQNGTRQ